MAFALSFLSATPEIALPAQTGSEKLRAVAWDALRSRAPADKDRNHARAVEAIMRELAGPQDVKDDWGLAGLLHDIDIATTHDDLTRHGIVGAQILRDLGFSAAVVHAVSAHDDRPGIARTSRLDHALYCADQIYWLILATGLKFPSAEFNASDSRVVWRKILDLPSKRVTLDQVSKECAEIGMDVSAAVDAAHAAMRRLSSTMTP